MQPWPGAILPAFSCVPSMFDSLEVCPGLSGSAASRLVHHPVHFFDRPQAMAQTPSGLELFIALYPALKSVRENCSFAPMGLVGFPLFPRLAPWAAFLRRFAAEKPRALFHRLEWILVLTHTLKPSTPSRQKRACWGPGAGLGSIASPGPDWHLHSFHTPVLC